MLYLSALLNRPVRGPEGAMIARVRDLVVFVAPGADGAEAPPPTLHGLVVGKGRRGADFFVPVAAVRAVAIAGITLAAHDLEPAPFERRERELRLAKDVWDRRVIDCAENRVRRVNDVVLGRIGEDDPAAPAPASGYRADEMVLLGVDIGNGALLRRLGLYPVAARVLGARVQPDILYWDSMEMVATGLLAAETHHVRLSALHPVEIARLTERVSTREAAELIGTLEDGVAAHVLEELPAERQIDIVEFLPDTRAADILEAMAPDDASDLLGDLPDARSVALLEHMDAEAVTAVRALLRYPDTTAGGMMTTHYVTVPQHLTAEQTIARLREDPTLARAHLIYYLYITEREGDDRLAGVLSLRDLLLAEPDTALADFMETDFLWAAPDEVDKEVARKMAEYNLLGLPVLDRDRHILGVVTVDDALDVLLPTGWQRRLPRILS